MSFTRCFGMKTIFLVLVFVVITLLCGGLFSLPGCVKIYSK